MRHRRHSKIGKEASDQPRRKRVHRKRIRRAFHGAKRLRCRLTSEFLVIGAFYPRIILFTHLVDRSAQAR